MCCLCLRQTQTPFISNPYEEDGDSEVQYKDVTTLDNHPVESSTDELLEINENKEVDGNRECIHESLHLDPGNPPMYHDLNIAMRRHSLGCGTDHTPEPSHTVGASHQDVELELEHSEYMRLKPDSTTIESWDASVGSVKADFTATLNATHSPGYDSLKRPAIEQLDERTFFYRHSLEKID